MRPEAVIFDIGNVLIGWCPERHYDRLIGPARRLALFDAVDLYAMNDALDRGAAFRETVYALACQHPEWKEEIQVWHDQWLAFVTHEIASSSRLLHALRAQGVPVFALSNFGPGPLALAQRAYPVLTAFDRRYISGDMGMAKPDPAIYARVEAECGIAPERLFFIDDRVENVRAAQARGWQAHVFNDPAVLGQVPVKKELLPKALAA